MTTLISSIIVLSILIFFHELGHFIAARASGILVHEFALGMGPKIFGYKKGDTLYSIRAFPIGGFCKMEGEDEASSDSRAFNKKSLSARFFVIVSGAFMNLILGFIIFIIMTALSGNYFTPIIENVLDGYPAKSAGIIKGDRIVAINGERVNIYSDIRFALYNNAEKEANIEVLRGNQKLYFKASPKAEEVSLVGTKDEGKVAGNVIKSYKIGITFEKNPSFANIIRNSYYECFFVGKLIFTSFNMLFKGTASVSELSGPVGIVKEIGGAARQGILSLLNITALITINLGIFNLLPIPALDGGRLVFLAVEAIRRKPISPEKEGFVHFIGFALLILLMIFATTNDISRIFLGK